MSDSTETSIKAILQPRFEVVEMKAKTRTTGYGVHDHGKGWICEVFMFSDMSVAAAQHAAADYAARHNIDQLSSGGR